MNGLLFLHLVFILYCITSSRSLPVSEPEPPSLDQLDLLQDITLKNGASRKIIGRGIMRPININGMTEYEKTSKTRNDVNVNHMLPFPTLKIVGSAASHFRFWKTINKLALPQVKFLQQTLELSLTKYCGIHSNRVPGDCMEFGRNLVMNWNSQDFIRSPSDDVMTIKNQKRFGKSMTDDVIRVLHYHQRNLTDLLAVEERHLCGDRISSSCDVTCPTENTPYCVIKEQIMPNLRILTSRLKKQAVDYFGMRFQREEVPSLNEDKRAFYSEYRVYYTIASLYNTMEQMHETEAALEYAVELSNIERLKVK